MKLKIGNKTTDIFRTKGFKLVNSKDDKQINYVMIPLDKKKCTGQTEFRK